MFSSAIIIDFTFAIFFYIIMENSVRWNKVKE